jgi:hypothetical protein
VVRPRLSPQPVEAGPEAEIPGPELLLEVLRPVLVLGKAQRRLELGISPQVAEMDPPAPAVLEKVQKLHINLGGDVVRTLRHEPDHVRLDGGRAHGAQNAHPLIPLLDVETPQVLVALDRVVDALAELGGAQVGPLHGELGVRPHEGEKAGGEGITPRLLRGAHHQIDGHLHHAQLDLGKLELFRPQSLDVGVQPPVDAVLIFSLPLLQGLLIVLYRFGACHVVSSLCNVDFVGACSISLASAFGESSLISPRLLSPQSQRAALRGPHFVPSVHGLTVTVRVKRDNRHSAK